MIDSFSTPGARKPSPGLMRRSARVKLAVPIEVRGMDSRGHTFGEKTQTMVISRTGALIVSPRLLTAGQQLAIRCLGTGKEAPARVVEQVETKTGGYCYGVEINSGQTDLWEINFPQVTDTEIAAPMLLECLYCHQCELAFLTLGEIETFQKNQNVSRPCDRCNNVTVWIHATLSKLQPDAASRTLDPVRGGIAPAESSHTEDKRVEARVALCIAGCIRSAEFGEEMIETDNVAKSGARIRGRKEYAIGTNVEVAIPFLPGKANGSAQARIIWSQPSAVEGRFAHGLVYTHAARRDPRLSPKTTISIAFIGGGFRAVGTVIDLSIRGVLVECREKFKRGDMVRLGIEMKHETMRIAATVRRNIPDVGTAFEFTQMGRNDRSLLRRLIFQIEKQLK
jgi:hypothetical protein